MVSAYIHPPLLTLAGRDHAVWHHANDVPTVPVRTWNQLVTAGRGVFVGSAFSIANPLQAWWGEGAERITVDGEAEPSLFGTGGEDYFGYGFCSPSLFAHPYHGQTRCEGPLNYGRTNLYRYTILDRIPFTRSFRFDMELMHWKDCLVDLDVIDYWYALPGSAPATAAASTAASAAGAAPASSPTSLTNLADLRPTRPFQVFHAVGAIEAEDMRIIAAPGATDIQEAWGDVGNGRFLRWRPSAPGDSLVLAFSVATTGDYRLIAQFIRGTAYGSVQLACNGVRASAPLALGKQAYFPDPSGEIDCGMFHLVTGDNRLELTGIAGPTAPTAPSVPAAPAGPAAPVVGAPLLVGLDYIIPLPLR